MDYPWNALFRRVLQMPSTADDESSDLKLAIKHMKEVEDMTSSSSSKSPQIHLHQCLYLTTKLTTTVIDAQQYLQSEGTHDNHKCRGIFKNLSRIAKEVERLVRECCNDRWKQSALKLRDQTQHVSLIAFELELCTKLLKDDHLWRGAVVENVLTELRNARQVIMDNVKDEVDNDQKNLLKKLEGELRNYTSKEWRLAEYVRKRVSEQDYVTDNWKTSSDEIIQTAGSKLGSGAFAAVYSATWLGLPVAVKTFPPLNQEQMKIFMKEISIMARLSHPHIVPMFGFAINQNGACSLIMEEMCGTLEDIIEEKAKEFDAPLGLLEGVHIMLQIAEGMRYLHEKRVVHRDLKPTNILVVKNSEKGSHFDSVNVQVKVADFGVSKIRDKTITESKLTVTGTTQYMAPELYDTANIEGSPKNAYKVDVYSFAIVCYEILMGKLIPFFGFPNANNMKKNLLGGFRPTIPATERSPQVLAKLIEMCWDSKPDTRPCFEEICDQLRDLECKIMIAETTLGADVREAGKYLTTGDGGRVVLEGTDGMSDFEQILQSAVVAEKRIGAKLKGKSLRFNKGQCHFLHGELVKALEMCKTCIAGAVLQVASMKEFYNAVKMGESLVEQCSSDKWLLKAVELGHNSTHFVEVLLDLHWWGGMVRLGAGQIGIWELLAEHEELLSSFGARNLGGALGACRDADEGNLQMKVDHGVFNEEPKEAEPECQLAIMLRFRDRAPHLSSLREFNTFRRTISAKKSSVVKEISWVYGKSFAIKERIHINSMGREAHILRTYRSPYIVALMGHWRYEFEWGIFLWNVVTKQPFTRHPTQEHEVLVMELMGMNLKMLIETKVQRNQEGGRLCIGYSPLQAIKLMLPVAKAMRFLHQNDVAHLNLHPENILCTAKDKHNYANSMMNVEDIDVKLAGFGAACGIVRRDIRSDILLRLKKHHDLDPELLDPLFHYLPIKFDVFKVDVHSFGTVLLYAMTWDLPHTAMCKLYPDESVDPVTRSLDSGEVPTLPEECPFYLKFVIESCWHQIPTLRPGFKDICRMLQTAKLVLSGVNFSDVAGMFYYQDSEGVKHVPSTSG